MSERRRMMLNNKAELITEGLQFWFDGKNNQGNSFSQSATTWYPYMKNSAIPDSYYLTKQGTGSWNSNGGFTASGTYGYFVNKSYLSPFYYLPDVNDFTFVICLDNLKVEESQVCPVGGTYGTNPGSNRWGLYINYEYYFFTININGSWQDYRTARILPTSTAIKTISFVRSGKNIRVYINGVYETTIAAVSDYLGKVYGVVFSLCAYDNGTPKINVPYYSCQMYDRALSDSEVVEAHKFITDRYGL